MFLVEYYLDCPLSIYLDINSLHIVRLSVFHELHFRPPSVRSLDYYYSLCPSASRPANPRTTSDLPVRVIGSVSGIRDRPVRRCQQPRQSNRPASRCASLARRRWLLQGIKDERAPFYQTKSIVCLCALELGCRVWSASNKPVPQEAPALLHP